MSRGRRYYHAYDDRYRQVHAAALQWSSDRPSAIVGETLARLGAGRDARLLEIGCGEGRDAAALLAVGWDLTATDVSPEAVAYCRKKYPQWAERFRVLDCLGEGTAERYDFIYAVAVLHMLVEDADRAGFYRFLRDHLTENGAGLVCTMGDGETERRSDPGTAFTLQERRHQETGQALLLAGTSCQMVGFPAFLRELADSGLEVLDHGLTAVEPDFPEMMYAVVRPAREERP